MRAPQRALATRALAIAATLATAATAAVDDVDAAVLVAERAAGRGVLLQLLIHGAMANETRPTWRALERAFRGSAEVFVDRVFCDERPCDALFGGRDIVALPAVLYGDPYELDQYHGSKTRAALEALGRSVRAPCSPSSPSRHDRCDDSQLAMLEGFEGLSNEDLDELATTADVARRARVDAIEEALDEKRRELLREWDAVETIRHQRTRRVAATLRVMRDVAAARQCANPAATRAPEPWDLDLTYAASELRADALDYEGGDFADYDDLEGYGDSDEYEDAYVYDDEYRDYSGEPYEGSSEYPDDWNDYDEYGSYYEDQHYQSAYDERYYDQKPPRSSSESAAGRARAGRRRPR